MADVEFQVKTNAKSGRAQKPDFQGQRINKRGFRNFPRAFACWKLSVKQSFLIPDGEHVLHPHVSKVLLIRLLAVFFFLEPKFLTPQRGD